MAKWHVIPSPTDPDMLAVKCHYEYGELHPEYLVADNLPIEDARMIAAAPELLEALEEVVANAVKNYEGSMDVYPEAIEVARAALAKAKGGA